MGLEAFVCLMCLIGSVFFVMAIMGSAHTTSYVILGLRCPDGIPFPPRSRCIYKCTPHTHLLGLLKHSGVEHMDIQHVLPEFAENIALQPCRHDSVHSCFLLSPVQRSK
ncbi:hypothetical protein BC628DRAFT_1093787 [Trametes gibbosa]|nr:hypothetical protein BC628DRAFT_1093787 [Trametes gibbosa]